MSSASSSAGSPFRRRHRPASSPLMYEMSIIAPNIHHDDPIMPINRAVLALQETIQNLLDAQSEGLLSGLGGHDSTPSTTSRATTPTSSTAQRQHAQEARTIPVRQPQKEKISLRGARRGLLRSMQDFAKLKMEEDGILSIEAERRKSALKVVRSFSKKRSGLEHEINRIRSEDQNQRLEALKSSAQEVEHEIHELETKLYELRAKHRRLSSEAKQLESTISANLSSYQESLRMVEKDIDRFLQHPPIETPLQITSPANSDEPQQEDPQPFYRLNPKRRTLSIAEESWTAELEGLSKEFKAVRMEHDAFIQGSELWSSALSEIYAFEKELHRRMQTKGLCTDGSQASGDDTMHSLIDLMDKTISLLTRKLEGASSQKWNLIVCCLGAEIQAIKEGRTMLADSLGIVEPASSENPKDIPGAHQLYEVSYDDGDDDSDPIDDRMHSALESSRNGLFHEDIYSDQEQWQPPSKPAPEQQPVATVSSVKSRSRQGSRSGSTTPRGSRHFTKSQPLQSQQQQQLISPSISPPPSTTTASASVSAPGLPPVTAPVESVSEDDEPGPEFLVSYT